MVELNIPLRLQDDDSTDCGPIASLMILHYFGITADATEVLKKVPRAYWGTSSYDNGSLLLDYGLSVEAITAHPEIFDGDFIKSAPDAKMIRSRIETVLEKQDSKDKYAILSSLLNFIDKNGVLNLAIPSKKHIVTALDSGKPVLAAVNANVWGANQGGYHFVVIGGYDKNKFLVYNPSRKSHQRSWEDAAQVLFGIHASTVFDFDNGSIFIITKDA
jgi:ABC-type bacteriocin/lantibiotic exporter with double-glycine peptidase domain